MELCNGRLLLVMDEKTGSVRLVRDREAGLTHFDMTDESAPARSAFRLMAPSPEWPGRHCDSGDTAPPHVTQTGETVALHYPDLRAAGTATGISASVMVEPGTDEVLFSIRVENRGELDIIETQFPWVGGWRGIGGPGKDRMIAGACAECDPHGYPANRGRTYARGHQRGNVGYPVYTYAPWLDISGPGGGVSLINYMRSPLNSFIAWENLRGYDPGLCLAVTWVFTNIIRPGESWESPPVGLSVHNGDWHDTADRYRAWASGWYRPAPTPRKVREAIGVQNVFFRNFDETPIRSFDTLPAVAAAGRKYGVDHLCVWDSAFLGTYMTPVKRDMLEMTEGDRAALSEGIRRARAEGTTVSALVNPRLIDPGLPVFEREGYADHIMRRYDGSPHWECWAGSLFHATADCFTRHLGPNCHVFSSFSPAYRERVARQMAQYAAFGFDAIFYDQPFEKWPDYAWFGKGRGPETTYAAVLEIVGEARRIMREACPDAYLIGEQCDIFGSQYIDWWMAWYRSIEEPIRAQYAIPDTMNSHVIDDSVPDAVHAFAAGLKLFLCVRGIEGTLDDAPELAAKVKQLAGLRSRTAERTALARFRDNCGIEVETSDHIVAYSYESAAGPAVVVASPGQGGAARVRIDRSAFSHPGDPERGEVLSLDGTRRAVRGDKQEFTLGESDAVVWTA